jgi:Xaa-Pro aminopeptidase
VHEHPEPIKYQAAARGSTEIPPLSLLGLPGVPRSALHDPESRRMLGRMWPIPTPPAAFQHRRNRLYAALRERPALLAAGEPRARNFPANRYPYRAESTFLYFVGRALPGAALLAEGASSTLFAPAPEPDDALWHGAAGSLDDLARELGIEVRPVSELAARLAPIRDAVATLPPNDDGAAGRLAQLLGRSVEPRSGARLDDGTGDALLAEAIIGLRLVHDEAAAMQLRQAAAATELAHRAGMQATEPGIREAAVCAAMQAEITRAGMTMSYEPIVTVHGEVLHEAAHGNVIGEKDLLLADVGAETPEGWAADVTRVWPAAGRFSPTQRALYEVVLETQTTAIALARPGKRYRDIHDAAARKILEGLLALGIFRGDLDSLFERGAHTLFFPHGVGHLLGLDVHDMEDLGDRAGYAPGRSRRPRFGDRYLRLDRDLLPGMAVTIEPGFYRVPAILEDREMTAPFASELDRDVLAQFADVRGIRIEDDVLVTAGEPEVLTASIPKRIADVEAITAR